MNAKIHEQILRRPRRAAEGDTDGDAATDGHVLRLKSDVLHRDRRLVAEAEKLERTGLAAFDRAPQRMFDERTALGRRVLEPAGAGLDEELRMQLAEVVQVVRHTSTDECRGVVLEEIEELQNAVRVVIEPRHPHGPRQPDARPLRDEPPHVRVRVARPRAKHCERALGVPRDVQPDAGLGGEALGELVLRAHRDLEMAEAVLRHEDDMRQVEERRHPDADQLVGRVFGTEGTQEDVDRVGILRWQMLGERHGDVPRAIEQLELVEAGGCLVDEPAGGERGMGSCHVCREPPHQRGRKERLERLTHPQIGLRGWSSAASGPSGWRAASPPP